MYKSLVTILGKTVKKAAQIRGGGSALPGLVVERIHPDFAKTVLESLPMGIIVITGTNGKTTTTKIVVELLESQGLKVFTNRTGSNFIRGVIAALLGEMDMRGRLKADIAVLELDEAYAKRFTESINPTHCLILNVMRDQLDRFGEVDHTAELLSEVAQKATKGVILNRNDHLIFNIGKKLKKQDIKYFSFINELSHLFPSDSDLHKTIDNKESVVDKQDITLKSFDQQNATYLINGKEGAVKLQLKGIYNALNVAAALALVKMVLDKNFDQEKIMKSLAKIKPAFGRGETLKVDGVPVEIILVKNPSGFRLGLKSYNPNGSSTMIAINDNFADGRDMSWLWDVDFSSLRQTGVKMVSGIRAYDMALRLDYDDVKFTKVDTDIKKALNDFLRSDNKPKRIYATYTCMLQIRKSLSKITKVEVIK